jgi:hypothetical protein
VAAVNELGVPQPGDVVYAITNGLEMDTHTSASRVEQAFLASGVRLFVAHLPMDMQALGARMNLNASVEQVRNLALDTGGIILPAITTAADPMRRDILDTMDWAKFDKWLTNFYEDMREYYLMELEFPPQAEGQKWKLELVQTADKRLAGRELVYPNKIPSCRPLH